MLTDEQLKLRKSGTGGSDIGAVAGLSPFRSPLSVYLDKTGQAPPLEENAQMRRGRLLEPAIANWWAEEVGAQEVTDPGTMLSPTHKRILATPDRLALVKGERLVGEIKSPGPYVRGFGEPGTDAVPAHILAQCHWEMHVANVERAHVAALLNGELGVFPIVFDPEFFGLLVDANNRFWTDYVEKGVPPPADNCDSELLKHLHPKDSGAKLSLSELPGLTEVIEALRTVRPQFKELEERHEALVNRVKQAMGQASHLETPFGPISWKANKASQATDWKAVAGEFRNLVALHAASNPELKRLVSELDTIEKDNTKERPGARPFVVRLKEAA